MWFSKGHPVPEALPFAWSSEEDSVGVTVFDQEHEHLMDLVAQIHRAVQDRHDRGRAQLLLEAFIGAAQAHFDHEEAVMRNIGFPDRQAHAAEHAELLREAKELQRKVQGGLISALTLPGFLKAWLLDHIHRADRKYAATMRRNGLH